MSVTGANGRVRNSNGVIIARDNHSIYLVHNLCSHFADH